MGDHNKHFCSFIIQIFYEIMSIFKGDDGAIIVPLKAAFYYC